MNNIFFPYWGKTGKQPAGCRMHTTEWFLSLENSEGSFLEVFKNSSCQSKETAILRNSVYDH